MNKRTGLLPFLFFVMSGGCALVYEVTWGRYLSLFLGNTTLAHMCVLAAFMGGLALGSIALGRLSARLANPLRFYGWLEIIIGAYAVAFPYFINPVEGLALSMGSGIPLGSFAWTGLKLAVSLFMLLLPTVLMGGTFPVLMRHFQPESMDAEDKTEWLYLANCAGAVCGTLLAGFVLVPGMGLSATLTSVGTANALLGAAAILVAGAFPRKLQPTETEAAPAEGAPRNPRLRVVYWVAGISGAVAMIYELVWIRLLAVTLGASTYSFTLMLSAFISGIALGSLAVGLMPWTRRRPFLWFAIAEMGIGFAVLAGIPLYERLPYEFWKWSSLLRPSLASVWLHDIFKYGLCFMVMIVPTFFSGMALPLAIKAVARHNEQIGRDAGQVYGANTAGTLAGALLAGLLLIPYLGIRSSLEIAVLANIAAGAVLFWVSGTPKGRLVAVGLFLCTAVMLRLIPAWHPASFSYGSFRRHNDTLVSWSAFYKWIRTDPVVYYGEDGNTNVAVTMAAEPMLQKPQKTLYTDGKADASSLGDMPTQVLLGQIPMFLKPDAKDVLVVGLGSGVSANSVLTHPDTQVDCVEISPAVARAAAYFGDVNGEVLANPRMNLLIEDARTVVAVTPKKYDIVISEPTNPWIAGMGNLFSQEFFRSVERVLKQDGIVVQWFHSYEISDDLVKVILRTLRTVFPYAYVFQGDTSDYIVVGSRKPIKPDFGAMEERIKVDWVKSDLDRVSIDSVAAFLGMQLLSPETTARIVGKGPINVDDHPILEYEAPKTQYADMTSTVVRDADERLRSGKGLFSVQYLAGKPFDRKTCASMARAYSDRRISQIRLHYALLEYYVTRWPENTAALLEYAKMSARRDASNAVRAAVAASYLNPDALSFETQSDVLLARRFRTNTAFTPQDFRPVADMLRAALQKDPNNPRLKAKLKMIQDVYQWGTMPYPELGMMGSQEWR